MRCSLFILLIVIQIIFLSACKNEESLSISSFSSSNEEALSVGSFSYSEDYAYWVSVGIGFKTEGFKNTKEQQIKTAEDALKLAKNEVKVTYDKTAISYDDKEKIWKVTFWMENYVGGGQYIYLNSNGLTILSAMDE